MSAGEPYSLTLTAKLGWIMHNKKVAEILRWVGELLEIKGENPFKVRAYYKAAEKVAHLGEDVAQFAARGALTGIPGIGKDLAAKITEIIETGKLEYYERLTEEIPPGILQLLAVPGIGPKKALALFKELNVRSLEDLEAAAKSEKIRHLKGFQERTEKNILRGIESARRSRARHPIGEMLPFAMALVEALRRRAPAHRVELAGSLRRQKDTVKDIDILAASGRPEEVIEVFLSLPVVETVLARGTTKCSISAHNGVQVDLRVVPVEVFGAALCYFTGSKEHNVRIRQRAIDLGLKVSEYGVFRDDKRIAGETEESVYAALGMSYVEPELREDTGEIEAALAHDLPALIKPSDLKGDFHVHSAYSDGTSSLEEIARKARALNYEWVAVCDHSQSLRLARGLTTEDLRAKLAAIRQFNASSRDIKLLCGAEVDILPDGSLDYPDEILVQMDFVLAAVHSAFRLDRERMTHRLLSAVRHPLVHSLAHPTGRILGQREPYDADITAVLDAAASTGTFLELNAYPNRLDINDVHCRAARDKGVLITIGSDAHTSEQMELMPFGISVARRGWLGPAHVVNTRSYAEIAAILQDAKKLQFGNNSL